MLTTTTTTNHNNDNITNNTNNNTNTITDDPTISTTTIEAAPGYRRRENMVGVRLVLAEYIKFKQGYIKYIWHIACMFNESLFEFSVLVRMFIHRINMYLAEYIK